jgi:hypothetical protein
MGDERVSFSVRWVSPSGEEGKWSVIVAVYIP